MTEEKKPKVVVIKNNQANQAAKTASPVVAPKASTKETEKKVFIKKKVTVKPIIKAKEEKEDEVKTAPSNVSVEKKVEKKPVKAATPQVKSNQAPKANVNIISGERVSSPLHNGPIVIKGNNLPPIHAKGETAPVTAKPRVAGVVGGRPTERTPRGPRGPRQEGEGFNNRGLQNGSSFTPRQGGQGNRFGNQGGPGQGRFGNNGQPGQNRFGNQGGPGQGRFGNNNAPGQGRFGNQGGPGQNKFGGNNQGGPGGYKGGGAFNKDRPAGGFAPRGPRGPMGGGAPQQGGASLEINQKGNQKKFGADKKKTQEYQARSRKDQELDFQFQQKKREESRLASVPKTIDIMDHITVSDLAKKMNLKASDIISKLFSMGMMVTINQQIDFDTASIIASEYGSDLHKVSLYDETLIEEDVDREEDLLPRAPIVTIMGHVDHGKTKTLDAIRSTDVVSGEFGGITQHIGAYKVSVPKKGNIVFLDTPGHAAFSMMRARGAQVTDIVVLVVAANDGVMPQTREAVDHAKAAGVPIIVAINKIDLPEAKPERVMQQLSDLGLMPEEWGGSTLYCMISALNKLGIDNLLDTILLQAEVLELKANPNAKAVGKVLESRIDQGRGTVATVIIEKGTLKQGDYYVAGIYSGRVRAMFDDRGKKILKAGPSDPVEIIGLSNIPSAGDPFQVTDDEKQARLVGAKRQELERLGGDKANKVTLDNLYDIMKEGKIQSLNVVIKGDVQGSVEALQGSLEKLSTSEIRLHVLRASAGAIIESDITLASASNAIVIGFNVRPTPRAQSLAEQEKVEIRKYNIIYDAVDDIRDAMEGMLSPDIKEVDIGKVEVREVFRVPKIGLIAGSYITEGKVKRNALCRVIRDSIQINKNLVKINSLKRFKDDAREVTAGYECGIGLENFQDLNVGDILEIVETHEVARKLESNE